MVPNLNQRVGFDTERSRASTTFTGSYLTIGTPLEYNPVNITFSNQTDVSVPISVDGANTWMTFDVGQSFTLDLRANHGIASNYTIDLGTQFYTNASVGTSGSMRISMVYAR